MQDLIELLPFAPPLAASILTGACIGFERELKAKSAGIKTHALVCFSAALLTVAGLHQQVWLMDPVPGSQIVNDPTRMVHGILTGIGFLCAGVIFRRGSIVHGLTTAASLWMTAALGVLYGTGMIGLALVAAAATLVCLAVLKAVQRWLPSPVEVEIELTCPGAPGKEPTTEIGAILAEVCRKVAPFGWACSADGAGCLRLVSTVWLQDAAQIAVLGARLRQVEGLTGIRIARTHVAAG